jgi:hypothetical protein
MKKCTYIYIVHIIFLNLASMVDIDLDPALGILFFDSVQERVEPFCTTEVTNDPSKVYLTEVTDYI